MVNRSTDFPHRINRVKIVDRFLKNRKPKEKPEGFMDRQTRIKLQPGEWDFRLKGPLENKKACIEKQRQA